MLMEIVEILYLYESIVNNWFKSTMFASNDGNIPDCIVTHSHKILICLKALDNMYEKTFTRWQNGGQGDYWNTMRIEM